jgi:heme A synthase
MLTEAAIGAGIVLLEYVAHDKSVGRAVWMAIHLVNTLLLVGAITWTAWLAGGRAAPRLRGQGLVGALTLLGAIGTLAVGVSGAITALGDTLFTTTSLARGIADDLSPAAHFLQQLRVIHPIVAVLVAVFLLYARRAIALRRPSPEAKRLSNALGALLVTQLALGFINVALLAPVWMQIVHLLFADLVWIAFTLLAATALAEGPAEDRAAELGAAGAPLGGSA